MRMETIEEVKYRIGEELGKLKAIENILISFDHAFGDGYRLYLKIKTYSQHTPLTPIFRVLDKLKRDISEQTEDNSTWELIL